MAGFCLPPLKRKDDMYSDLVTITAITIGIPIALIIYRLTVYKEAVWWHVFQEYRNRRYNKLFAAYFADRYIEDRFGK